MAPKLISMMSLSPIDGQERISGPRGNSEYNAAWYVVVLIGVAGPFAWFSLEVAVICIVLIDSSSYLHGSHWRGYPSDTIPIPCQSAGNLGAMYHK